MKAYLIREYFETHTLGVFVAVNNNGNIVMSCSMLELPWRDNAFRVSCIPEGSYSVIEAFSQKFKRHYRILDVPNRDGILQHAGNYTSDVLGCQMPGSAFANLNKDGIPDIINSRKTLDKMLEMLGPKYELFILSRSGPPKNRGI